MQRIANRAEDVQDIPTAENYNAAFTESALKSISERSGEKDNKPHGFSKTVAQIKNARGDELGANAAILLRYLSFRVRKHGKNIDGKRWVRINLDHLAKQYSYMGRSTVDENVIRLANFGCCEIK